MKVLWRRGVIQLTRGVRRSVWSGFEPNHGSVTARVGVSISSLTTTDILATGAKTPFRLHLQCRLAPILHVIGPTPILHVISMKTE